MIKTITRLTGIHRTEYQFHKNEHLEFINKLDEAVPYSFLTGSCYR